LAIALHLVTARVVAAPITFTVNSPADVPDVTPGDGICATSGGTCTLRAAIQEANAHAGTDTIVLQAGVTYLLTRAGAADDTALNGDLDITDSVNIIGAGPGSTIIDGNRPVIGERVFQIIGAAVTVNITGVSILNGGSSGLTGGGISSNGILTLTNTVVSGNTLSFQFAYGGGIANSGTLTLVNSVVTGNVISGSGNQGAGIGNTGTLTLLNSTVSTNIASLGLGGGLYTFTGTVRIIGSTIGGNVAGAGGGIFKVGGSTTLINSTISANNANSGGALYVDAVTPNLTSLFNVTIAGNSGSPVGGVYVSNGPVTIANSLIAGNGTDCAGTLTSQGNNLVGPGCTVIGSASSGNPVLGPLVNNGGATLTLALLAGSAAIDAGNAGGCVDDTAAILTTDQRGFARPVGARCDIGAYEVGSGASHDLNGSGQADIVWHNPSTTENGVWLMNGSAIQGAQAFPAAPFGFQIVGVGDFNGDGRADLLWRNLTTGEDGIWLMNGSAIVNSQVIPSVAPNWVVAGIGDFNDDGFADIVWQDSNTGQAGIWEMNAFTPIATQLISGLNPGWAVVGVGDFNDDGRADLLWRHSTTGQAGIWLMSGFTPITTQLISGANPDWRIAGVGDFNGDGKADILWRNPTTGDNGLWQMNGFTIASAQGIPGVSTAWEIH
jgi:CSLREA domain-containing protein